jgi:drug/metabolite transporter (DMT)-like permease
LVRLVFFIAIVVLAGTAGDIAVTHAMKKIGEVDILKTAKIFHALSRAFRTGWMWLGISLMAVSFFSLLALLSWADVSIVVPATAFSYVIGAFGAKFLLHEKVPPIRWAGVLLVCVGVALLSLS